MAFTFEKLRPSRISPATIGPVFDFLRGRRSVGRDRAGLAIVAIVASSLVIALSDVFSKFLTRSLPPIEVAWLRFSVFTLLLLPMFLRRGGVSLRSARPWTQLVRGVASGGATGFAITGFGLLPVAEATAIGFVAPVFVTALAVLVLGENVGVRRWAAALVGLAGVMIIVQPGTQSFQMASLLPLAAAFASACAIVATRCLRAERASTTLVYTALGGTLVITPLALSSWVTPSGSELSLAFLSGAFAAASNVLQIYAYRCAPASLVVPFTYTQMIFASVFGMVVFGYVPGAHVLIGAAVIAASGIYTAYRERVRKTSAFPAASNG